MDKKMKLILIGLALTLILAFTSLIYFMWTDEEFKRDDPSISNQDSETKDDKEDEQDEVEDVDLKLILNESRKRAMDKKYNEALNVIIYNIKKHNIDKHTDYSLIRDQEIDLLSLAQLEMQYENGFIEDALDSVRNMNYPENFFVGYLSFNYDYKTRLTSSGISLLPPPNFKIENLQISELTAKNDVTELISATDTKLESIFIIKLTYMGSNLTGYIAKNDNGFYLYELNGETDYMLTVDDWNELKGDESNDQ